MISEGFYTLTFFLAPTFMVLLLILFRFVFFQSGAEKRAATDVAKKPKTPKKKKKKDPNEPQKPVSAYALFFRDTQAAIKGQNPNATFGEVSKIVASMWDGLGEEQKQVLQSSPFIFYDTLCYFLKKIFTGLTKGTKTPKFNDCLKNATLTLIMNPWSITSYASPLIINLCSLTPTPNFYLRNQNP